MPEIVFKGKEFVYNHHLTVPYRPLVVDADKGVGAPDLSGNLVIHGDNLAALKSLLPRYAGKVDLIFIDPPYNTGNEGWCYSDGVNSPIMREWLSTNPVDGEDMLRHDKWLCMMWPRLTLLRELLSERGSLWMTLDDNEEHRARMVMDELFGDGGFAASCVWQKKYTVSADNTGIAPMHDYVLVYGRPGFERRKLERTSDADRQYKFKDAGGTFRVSDYTCNKTADERPNLYYPIKNPKTGIDAWPSRSRVWGYGPDLSAEHAETGLLWWGEDGTASTPYFKRYRESLKDGGKLVPGTWWDFSFADHTDIAKKEVLQVFGELASNLGTIKPKPTRLIERVLDIGASEDALILDSFAGSGTTAHAVLKANAKDNGDRRFILIEGEPYADTLTAERVRRAINGYAWVGTQRETLFEQKLTFTQLKKADALLAQVEGIKAREGFADAAHPGDLADQGSAAPRRFDSIEAKVIEGVLRVEGVRKISERAPGLGGSFTYCTLGEPLNLEKMLSGERLPSSAALGEWLFHTATGATLPPPPADAPDWYLGLAQDKHVWLVYRPELMFLKSPQAALTLSLAQHIAEWGRQADAQSGVRRGHLVFAPAKYLSNQQLRQHGVDFAPLPFALYREG